MENEKVQREEMIAEYLQNQQHEIDKGLFSNALHKMSIMLVVIVNEVNFGQIFLWLQEKSLFGNDVFE